MARLVSLAFLQQHAPALKKAWASNGVQGSGPVSCMLTPFPMGQCFAFSPKHWHRELRGITQLAMVATAECVTGMVTIANHWLLPGSSSGLAVAGLPCSLLILGR